MIVNINKKESSYNETISGIINSLSPYLCLSLSLPISVSVSFSLSMCVECVSFSYNYINTLLLLFCLPVMSAITHCSIGSLAAVHLTDKQLPLLAVSSRMSF